MLAELRPKAEAAVPWKIVGSDPWGPEAGQPRGPRPAPDLPYEKNRRGLRRRPQKLKGNQCFFS